jgi:hypothetical protein
LTECKADKKHHASSLKECQGQLKEESETVKVVTRDWIDDIKNSRWMIIVTCAGYGIFFWLIGCASFPVMTKALPAIGSR